MLMFVAIAVFCGLVSTTQSMYNPAANCNPFFRLKCLKLCPWVSAPVCGSNGVTYFSECFLERANCVAGSGPNVVKDYDGKCSDRNCNKACYEIYQPVCGTDNKTYSNDCYLSIAHCKRPKDAGPITEAYKGECQKKNCDQIACTKDYRPVCGSDGKTYSNQCVLSVTNCRLAQSGSPLVTVASKGECLKRERCGDACITLYDPVCGSNGVTYSNSCFLGIASCTSRNNGRPSFTVAYKGRCGSGSSDM